MTTGTETYIDFVRFIGCDQSRGRRHDRAICELQGHLALVGRDRSSNRRWGRGRDKPDRCCSVACAALPFSRLPGVDGTGVGTSGARRRGELACLATIRTLGANPAETGELQCGTLDPRARDYQLRKLARRYGVNTLRRWYYDEPLAYVMSFAD
jgi:hypothetical protein